MGKYTKGKITEFTKKLIRTNKSIWRAIYDCEDLVQDDMFKELNSDIIDNEEYIKIIAERFKKYSDRDDFADEELNGRYFQDFDEFANKILEH